jgi:hypothetical protein
MARTPVFVTIAFLAGLALGLVARGAAGTLQRRTHATDLAAIEKAHQEDIEATLTQDPKKLIDLWAGGGCGELQSGKPTCGRQAGHSG